MADASDRRSLGRDPFQPAILTPSSWGKNDAGEPFSDTTGNTPGPAGTGGDRAQQIALDAGSPVAPDGGVPNIPDASVPNIPDAGLPAPMSADAGTQADSDGAKKKALIDAQDDVMSDVSLAPGDAEETDEKGKKKTVHRTHCSEATLRVAKKTGVLWLGILGDKNTNFRANEQIANLEKAAKAGTYVIVEPDEAQKRANKGITVFATQPKPGSSGHIATIRPEGIAGDAPRKPYKKPLLANVGAHVGVTGYLGVHGESYGEFEVKPGDADVVFYAPAK